VTTTAKMRVWILDEFKDCDEDEREDLSWSVPDRRGILYPENAWRCDDPREAAKVFAEYFHNQRDGWECTWPIEVVVHDGDRYWIVEVARETVPEFLAAKPKPFAVEPVVSKETTDQHGEVP